MAGSPLFMQDVKLTLKLLPSGPSRIAFECDISLAEIIPTPGDSVDYSTLCASGSYSSIGKTTYALHLVAVQRWAADGLAAFLWDNDGQLAEFQYQAHGAAVANATDTPGMFGTVRLVAGNYGGEVSTYAELDVTLPCTVKPTKTLAVFPTIAEAEAETEDAATAAA